MRAFEMRNGVAVPCDYTGPDRRVRERRQIARERTRGRRGARRPWTPGTRRFYVPPPMSPYADPVPMEHQCAHRLRSPSGVHAVVYLPVGVAVTQAHCDAVSESWGASPEQITLRVAGFGRPETWAVLAGVPGACLRAERILRDANRPEDEGALQFVRRQLQTLAERGAFFW